MLSVNWQDIKPVLSLGVELWQSWHEFPEFKVMGLIILARVLLEVCIVGTAYLHQPKPGAIGPTERTQHRSDMPSALPWLPQPYQHWSCPQVIVLRSFLNFLLWLKIKLKVPRKPRRLFLLLKKFKAWNNIKKVYASQRMRAGKGKMKNCHRIQRRGPASFIMRTSVSSKTSETFLELLCLM